MASARSHKWGSFDFRKTTLRSLELAAVVVAEEVVAGVSAAVVATVDGAAGVAAGGSRLARCCRRCGRLGTGSCRKCSEV